MSDPTQIMRVPVDLGERSYDIVIGNNLLARLGEYIAPLTKSRRLAVITDATVDRLHGETLRAALSEYQTHMIIRPEGEAEKSMASLEAVLDNLFQAGLDRSDLILTFGGGVVGDLGGFAASIFKRGAPFVQIPTTLLAQVDSSVGGKTAINTSYGKNLIGAFYQPRLVLTDLDVLHTLPARHLRAGYAEIVKYGLLGDADFFEELDTGLGAGVLALDPAALQRAIALSCQTKARIVAADEREAGQRALLNLGHTFAHALELAAGYDGDLLHGEAVSAGMELAFEYSQRVGVCPPTIAETVGAHLDKLGLTRPSDLGHLFSDPTALHRHMSQDKKNEDGLVTLILARAIGDAFVQKGANSDALKDYLIDLERRYA